MGSVCFHFLMVVIWNWCEFVEFVEEWCSDRSLESPLMRQG
jgi:hypothetical protein